jgi:hypothetical protein
MNQIPITNIKKAVEEWLKDAGDKPISIEITDKEFNLRSE